MLPHPNDAPSGDREPSVRVAIPCHVGVDLLAPPSCVRSWGASVLRAPMPETAVDKDRNSLSRKSNVGSATHSRERVVHAEPQSFAVKRRSKGGLRSSISLPLPLHSAERLSRARRWSNWSTTRFRRLPRSPRRHRLPVRTRAVARHRYPPAANPRVQSRWGRPERNAPQAPRLRCGASLRHA